MKILSRLFAPAAIMASLCLLVPDQVQAASHGGGGHGGGGRGGGGHVGGGRAGGFARGGGRAGGFARGGGGFSRGAVANRASFSRGAVANRGGFGRGGFGRGGFERGGFGRGYGYGGYGGWGGWGLGLGYGLGDGYGYYQPWYNIYPTPLGYTTPNVYSPAVVSVDPGVVTQQSAYYNPVQGTTATVEVRVPADARVWFDGVATTKTGADRVFNSPPLEPGKAYHYEVKARWMQDGTPVERTQSIEVTAGQLSVANFVPR